jgi:hypothetical protein
MAKFYTDVWSSDEARKFQEAIAQESKRIAEMRRKRQEQVERDRQKYAKQQAAVYEALQRAAIEKAIALEAQRVALDKLCGVGQKVSRRAVRRAIESATPEPEPELPSRALDLDGF